MPTYQSPTYRSTSRTNFVSLSGVDGAGKSTQIEALCGRLRAEGLEVRVIRFWDDIATLTQFREAAGHTLFRGDKGIGTPSAPINRKDKNVRSWPMAAARLFLYFLDAFSTRRTVKRALRSGADLVIFDRYIYDELANLSVRNPAIRWYIRLIMKIVPRPDISYLLDASPEKARARKPEYPIEFLHTNRKAYFDLVDLVGGITVIDALPLAEVTQAIIGFTLDELPLKAPHCEDENATPSKENRPTSAKLDRVRAW
jgi:thymidylate kinase